jgi:hypothetical protein
MILGKMAPQAHGEPHISINADWIDEWIHAMGQADDTYDVASATCLLSIALAADRIAKALEIIAMLPDAMRVDDLDQPYIYVRDQR